MALILTFLKEASFDPDTTQSMGEAFDRACQFAQTREPAILEALAKRILAHAQQGERNPDRLCQAALSALGVLPIQRSA